MINKFQKSIWILSSSAPIMIGFAISWWVHERTWLPSLIALCSSLVLIIALIMICKNIASKLPSIDVNVKKVTQNDRPVIGYTLSYILSFGSISFDKYNPTLFFGFAMALYVVMIFSNALSVNPLLFFAGYHFYDIETENGIGNYLLMTKNVIRNKDEICVVKRVFEYFLIM